MTAQAYFVTGTDTDVGKTLISSALLFKARQRGASTAAVKPIACGTLLTPHGPLNEDAIALHHQCSPALTLSDVNPLRFEAPTSPHIAAAEAGTALNVDVLLPPIVKVLNLQRRLTLIEGAGGWRVPLNDTDDLSDVAKALALPVIMVVGIKLGALNHAFLSYDAIVRDGLKVAGWVANSVAPPSAAHRLDQYLGILNARIPAPCLGIVPFVPSASPADIAQYIDLDLLMKGTHRPPEQLPL